MNGIVLFLLKSIIVTAVLVTWYWLGLRNKRLHNYNRFFLLFTLYASIQVPLLHFQWFTFHAPASAGLAPVSMLLHVVSDHSSAAQFTNPVASAGINWSAVIFVSVAMISFTLLSVYLMRVLWVVRMSRKYPRHNKEGIILITTNLQAAPFSFLNLLFWNDSISPDTENGRLIFEHELAHIKQRHTYDKLACQLLTCICWFNPFYWIIQKELGMIHEFIADEQAISENDTDAFARMLLQAHYSNSYLVPEHQFFSSPIKRRLIMLQKSKKTSFKTLRRMMVLPLAAGAIFIFSFGQKAKVAESADEKIVLVLDAGHGGMDAGAQYESIKEKDINLKIATRIKELSPQYNIETHLTRSDDKTLKLQERVNSSNSLHPDDFISIHVTDDAARDMRNGSFDIYVCAENPKLDQSKELAYAVYQQINRTGFIQKEAPSEKGLYVLRYNNAPGILIEFGDIKDKDLMERITDEAKLDELCRAVLMGIVETHKKQKFQQFYNVVWPKAC